MDTLRRMSARVKSLLTVSAAAAIGAALAAVVSACGSAAQTVTVTSPVTTLTQTAPAGLTSSTATVSTTSTVTTPTTTTMTVPIGQPVGTIQHVDVGDANLAVTVIKLTDPLNTNDAALLPGYRAVAINVRISSTGPAVYDSSATTDFSVESSWGHVMPLYVPSGPCKTPLRDFDNYITTGQVRTGCLAFSVSTKAWVIAIRFSPNGKPEGRLVWLP